MHNYLRSKAIYFNSLGVQGHARSSGNWALLILVYTFVELELFPICLIEICVNHTINKYFASFEAPGMLKTAPACIFHHI